MGSDGAVRTSAPSVYFNDLRRDVSRKAAVFSLAAVRTWNRTGKVIVSCFYRYFYVETEIQKKYFELKWTVVSTV
jgi:hypothetical protein